MKEIVIIFLVMFGLMAGLGLWQDAESCTREGDRRDTESSWSVNGCQLLQKDNTWIPMHLYKH